MNDLAGNDLLNYETIKHEIKARDLQIDNPFTKDPQVAFINNARQFLGNKLVRTAKPHKILSGRNGRLIAVKLNIISRKTLGGIQTNLDGQALNPSMQPIQDYTPLEKHLVLVVAVFMDIVH